MDGIVRVRILLENLRHCQYRARGQRLINWHEHDGHLCSVDDASQFVQLHYSEHECNKVR